MRSKIVSRKKLNTVAKSLGLVNQIRRNKKSQLGEDIHGNLYEALIGAIFLDYGMEKCKDFIHRTILINEKLDYLEQHISSYKGFLLEYSQKNKVNINFKTVEEENAQKNIVFVCELYYNDVLISKGRESSKKKAEEKAAQRAYYSLQNQINL